MSDNAELKQRICDVIDAHAEEIIGISTDIANHPETGFRETRTADVVLSAFERLGLPAESGLARTGVKTRLSGRESRASVGIVGELDALVIPGHPRADPVTGAAHACGHHAQVAAMVGAAMGLRQVANDLFGDVVFLAVPAEECVQLDWRLQLRAQGEIEFVVGKPEMIKVGAFDDVDMAMLTHTPARPSGALASVGDSHNGGVMKQLRFTGRAAHAGAFPHLGINALKAAQLALLSVDAQRETFRDEDNVRVHYVMEHAGESVNIVPAQATVELQVRAKTIEALSAAERVVDRCVHGACIAFAADGEVRTVSGYLPHHQDDDLTRLLRANCETLVGADRVSLGGHVAGCTDMGDLSYLMPVVHPRSAGTTGAAHGSDFDVVDHVLAAVNPAKWMAMTVVDLLTDQADNARSILAKRERPSRADYLAVRRNLDHLDTFSALAGAAGGTAGAV